MAFLVATIVKTTDGRYNVVAFEPGGGTSTPSHLHSSLEEAVKWLTEKYGEKPSQTDSY